MQKLTLALVAAALNFAGAAESIAAEEKDGRVYYKDGLRIEAGDTNMKFNVQLQPRFEFIDNDGENADDTSGTRLRRARAIFSGDALDKQFSYVLNNDFSSDSGGGDIKDAWLQWNNKAANIRFGRMKVPLTRQTLVSSSNLFFADRSIVDDFFTADRDQGGLLHGKLGETGRWHLGIFNGDSEGESDRKAPVDNEHNGVASVDFSTADYGSRGLEGDFRDDKGFDATAGASVIYGHGNAVSGEETDAMGETVDVSDDFDQVRLNGDVGVRFHGTDVQAEISYRSLEFDDANDSTDQVGFYVQATHNLDENWGFGGRYGWYDPDDADTDDVTEYTVGLDYFISGHRLKIQNQATFKITSPDGDGDDDEDFRYILQLAALI